MQTARSLSPSPSAHIHQKQGCPTCASLAAKRDPISFTEFVRRSREKHGTKYKYFKKHYRTLNTPTLIYCPTHKQRFVQLPTVHITGCSACKSCSQEKMRAPRLTVSDWLRRFRERHGDRYSYPDLSSVLRSDSRIMVVCPTHGAFEQRVLNHSRGDGCAKCGGSARRSLEDIREFARARGCTLVSKKYVNGTTPMRWRCAHGHQWQQTADRAMARNLWCPTCAGGRFFGEEIVRALLQAMFNDAFPNVFPRWLKGLQLDGYCERLGIAFEHQGRQHYGRKTLFHKNRSDFRKQALRDMRKARLCGKQKVRLLVVPSVPDVTSVDELRQLCDRFCRRYRIKPTRYAADVSPADLELRTRQATLSKLREVAERRGGQLLSRTYLGAASKLLWQCHQGHRWHALPSSVLKPGTDAKGTWCPQCARVVPLTLEELGHIAASRGGECLSARYENSHAPMRWRCKHGHEWEQTATVIKHRQAWCPTCSGRRSLKDAKAAAVEKGGALVSKTFTRHDGMLRWKCSCGRLFMQSLKRVERGSWCPTCCPRTTTVGALAQLAAARGGKCLTRTVLKSHEKYRWRCAKGHEWETQLGGVRNGSWCPHCAGVVKKTLADMQEMASGKGGKCLSSKYTSMHSKLTWACSQGHTWDATPAAVKNGAWCPSCAGNRKRTIEDARTLAASQQCLCTTTRYNNARTKMSWSCNAGHKWRASYDEMRRRAVLCLECKRTR